MTTIPTLMVAATLFVSTGVLSGQPADGVPAYETGRAVGEVGVERVACRFAVADAGSLSARFNDGTCAIQDGALSVVILDGKRQPTGAEKRVELRDIRSVSLQSRQLKEQLQLPVGDSVLVLNVLSDTGQRKSRERALAFFSALRDAGVRPANGFREINDYPTGASTW